MQGRERRLSALSFSGGKQSPVYSSSPARAIQPSPQRALLPECVVAVRSHRPPAATSIRSRYTGRIGNRTDADPLSAARTGSGGGLREAA
jgi:hypothetical protein